MRAKNRNSKTSPVTPVTRQMLAYIVGGSNMGFKLTLDTKPKKEDG